MFLTLSVIPQILQFILSLVILYGTNKLKDELVFTEKLGHKKYVAVLCDYVKNMFSYFLHYQLDHYIQSQEDRKQIENENYCYNITTLCNLHVQDDITYYCAQTCKPDYLQWLSRINGMRYWNGYNSMHITIL